MSGQARLNVLLVSGDRELSARARELIGAVDSPPCDFRCAPHWEGGLRLLEANDLRLCLIDARADALDPVKCLEEMRARSLWVPVLVLADRRDAALRARVLEAGAMGCLDRGELNAAVLEFSLRHALECMALRESEETFSTAFRSSPVAMAISSVAEGRYVDVNHRFEDLSGFRREEVIGKTSVELGLWRDPSDRDRFVEKLMSDGSVRDLEFEMLDRMGNLHTVLLSAERISLSGELHLLTLVEDVTEQRRAEKVRASFDRLSLRLTGPLSLRELSLTVAQESRLLFGYDAFLLSRYDEATRLLTPVYGEDTAVGETEPRECPLDPLRDVVISPRSRLINRESPPDTTTFDRFGEPARLSRSLMFAPIRWHGRTIGVISVQSYHPLRYRDSDLQLLETLANHCGGALARVRMETALRETELKFRTVAESVPAALFIFDGPRMLYVNRGAEMISGYTAEELAAMEFWDVVHPDDRGMVRERGLARLRGEAIPQRYEVKILTKSGEERWVDYSSGVLDLGGHPVVIGIAFDITERKRAERLAALGMTASALAHHIKNIQTHLSAASKLLDAGLRTGNQATVSRAWPIMRRSSERIGRLVHNMLALAREHTAPREPVDINEMVLEILSDCREKAEEETIRLECELDAGLPTTVADPSAVHDCILNLVLNAIEAITGERSRTGVVTVTTALDRERDLIVLTVEDNGPGMDATILAHLFEPFFTTKGSRGTGLGLPVVRRAIEQMGGTVRATANPGQGSLFTVELPVKTPGESG